AAGAEDAIAAPFVEGRLRRQTLTIDIDTQCVHCARKIAISIDSELRYDAPPGVLVFEPRVDWSTFGEPNIIRHY
ncbi:MAG TPA: hypothetical protein VLU46_04045, partial [Thermoanaerobaculia bacterium]|nr:hypothetical protein [Thermoanaerobaculia bacterium]